MAESVAQKTRNDVLLRLARCSEIKLFSVVFFFRLLILLGMLFTHALLPKIIGVELLFDSGVLLHNDIDGQWAFLDFTRSWDVVHFSHISKHGYSHENVCAFFPFVPFILWLLSWGNRTLLPSSLAIIPVSFQAALLNVFCSAAAAVILRRITVFTLVGSSTTNEGISVHPGTWLDEVPPPPSLPFARNKARHGDPLLLTCWREVGAAVLMWMLIPAAVFTVVPYTESAFSLFTFMGLYFLIIPPPTGSKGAMRRAALTEFGAVICFTVAGFIRSNAFVCAAFLLYPIYMQIFFFETYKRRFPLRYGSTALPSRWPSVLRCVVVIAEVGIMVAPFLLMNYFCFNRFSPLWNDTSTSTIGHRFWAFYGRIQKHYWNVGFLTSYTLKNLPNVLISFPVVYFTLKSLVKLFLYPSPKKVASPVRSLPVSVKGQTFSRHATINFLSLLRGAFHVLSHSSNIICILLVMLIGVTMVHVNVVNRFVMSYPALYWILGRQIVSDPHGAHTVVMFRFFFTWISIGVLFFPNGMPWT